MAEAVERTDELVREYLLFRGFTHTLRQLDAEIKADKEKGFRVRGRQGRRRRLGGGPPAPTLPSGARAALSLRGWGLKTSPVWPSLDFGGTEGGRWS